MGSGDCSLAPTLTNVHMYALPHKIQINLLITSL